MADSVGLIFKVTADTKEGQEQFKRFGENIENATSKLKTEIGGRFTSLAQSIGVSTTALAGIAVSAGVALIGLEKLVEGGKFLFELTEKAAEAGEALLHISERSLVAVESIGALKIAAHTAGVDFQALGAGITKFTGSLVDAANGNKKLTEALQYFGLNAKTAFQDPDQAISTFITKFNSLPESAQKNRAEMLLFRDRTGELIPVFKAAGANFDEFKKKLHEAGLLMSDEEARASEDFSKQLKELGDVSERVGQKFAAALMPAVTGAMRDISTSLTSNVGAWHAWADGVASATNYVRALVRALGKFNVHDFNFMDLADEVDRQQDEVTQEDTEVRRANQSEATAQFNKSEHDKYARGYRPESPAFPDSGSKGKDTAAQKAAEAQREADKAAQIGRAKELEDVRHQTDELKRNYELRLIDLETYTVAVAAQNQRELDAATVANKAKQDALDANTKLTKAKRDNAQAEIDLDAEKAQNKFNEAELNRAKEYNAAKLALDREQAAQEKAIHDEQDARELARIQDSLDQKRISNEAAARAEAVLEQASLSRHRTALEDELKLTEANLVEHKRIQNEIDVLDEKQVTSTEEWTRRIIAARMKDLQNAQDITASMRNTENSLVQTEINTGRARAQQILANTAQYGKARQAAIAEMARLDLQEAKQQHDRNLWELNGEEARLLALTTTEQEALDIIKRFDDLMDAENNRFNDIQKQITDAANKDVAAAGKEGGFLSGLGSGQLSSLSQGIKSFADVATVAFNAVGAAINGVAQGVGSMVKNWVLMGNQGGASFRKLAAEILASIAEQAAVLAVMSLAYAALATTVVGSILLGGTPAQFLQAALLFGAVAVGTAVVGRAVAGNAFQSQTAAAGAVGTGANSTVGGGGSSSSGRGGDYYSSKDEESISQNRWGQMSRQDRNLVITLKTDRGHILDTVHTDINDAGQLREAIIRVVR